MELSDLIFTGFNKRVAALNKATGEIVWQWEASHGRNYLTLLLDGPILIVGVDGYMFGLDALSGKKLWFNEMTGFRTGVVSLASVNGSAQNSAGAAAEARARAAASSGAGANA